MAAFYTKTIKPREMAFLNRISVELVKLDLPKWWRRGDTLRYGYVNNFETDRTLENIKLYVDKVKEIMERELEHITLGFIVKRLFINFRFSTQVFINYLGQQQYIRAWKRFKSESHDVHIAQKSHSQ